MTDNMKESDTLFAEMFQDIFYGGSFYDGLKVANPDEYDLDLLLTLPSRLTYELSEASNVPGFVHVKFQGYTPAVRKRNVSTKPKVNQVESVPLQRNVLFVPPGAVGYQQSHHYYQPRNHQPHNQPGHYQPHQRTFRIRERGMDQLINQNGFLATSKVLQWMQGVVQKALNLLERDGNGCYVLETPQGYFYLQFTTSGPAFTLKATGLVGTDEVYMSIDLVPCFVFTEEWWPKGNFRKNPVNQKPNFFIVPKPLRGIANDHYWRLSFQEQERVLLENKEKLKPTIKLLKKMKDFQQHDVIASYFIKTVALWTIDEQDSDFCTSSPLSYVFMTVLKNYHQCLESGEILYYWDHNYNLLGKLNPKTIRNISNKVGAIIDDIERHGDGNSRLVAKYLVSSEELLELN